MENFWKLHQARKLLPQQPAHEHDLRRTANTATNERSNNGGTQNYTQHECAAHYGSNEQLQQHYAHSTATLYAEQQQRQRHCAPLRLPPTCPELQQQQQQEHQLTSAAAAVVDNFRFSVLYALVATSASAFTYNMHSLCASIAPEADPTTLELKRHKASTAQHQHQQQQQHYSRLLHATACAGGGGGGAGGFVGSASSLDSRSIIYLSLLLLIYCSVLIRASAATTPNVQLENKTHALEPYELRQLAAQDNSSLSLNATVATPTAATVAADNDNDVFVVDDRYLTVRKTTQQRVFKRDAANVPDDEDDSAYHDDEVDEYDALINNKSAKGKYIGALCYSDMTCEPTLLHVTCDKETQICGCEKNYPVQLGLTRGCAKPKKLGEQCFYDETCIYNDENSLCVQVRHNALCQCASGYHSVSYTKPTKRVFCTQDLNELNSDLPTLLGVTTGIAVLAGLICMVLHLFSKTKYPRHRNFGDANLPPPIMYSSDTGIPLTVQSGRPSSRSSLRSSGSIGSYGNRRASSGGGGGGGGGVTTTASAGAAKGILVSTSRTGAARSAAILLISCHISSQSKQNSRATSRQTSGAGCSANSRDNLDENGSGGTAGSRSCDSTLSMTRHLQKQLNHQRHLLSLELSPKGKNNDRIRALLGINGIDNYRTDDDDELNSLNNGNGNHLQIGALPTPASDTPRFAVLEDQV